MRTIEVHHIDRSCKPTTQKTFPVHWSTSGSCASEILATRILQGDEAETMFEIMRRALKGEIDYTLCGHYPNYGLRVIDDETTTFETTVCLSCRNWIRVRNGEDERFKLSTEFGAELASALQQFLPLSAEEVAQLNVKRKMEEDLQSKYPAADTNPQE